ncbi:hypothetical protein PG985_015820 [Apiospora marii]|uniref:Uncharacterized protein n=1 Tax=Apiospora marii TaxID=335849 RepID=A0ABR1S4G4_9PEZI
MTEPENMEDDLFADLYDDNEPAAAPAPAKQEQPVEQPPAPAPAQPEPHVEEEPAYDPNQNGYNNDDYQQQAEYEDDDDDDVDFNLGNNPPRDMDTSTPMREEASTPNYHSTRGPSAKEDG